MAKELNEDSGFKVSIKTLVGIGVAMATIIGMWFALQADIQEAKELPAPPKPEETLPAFEKDLVDRINYRKYGRRCRRTKRRLKTY